MKARVIAYYLPQFHPIPENDKWWGKGFTEWTNVAKAKPLFKGHYQPKIPADLGFYDLRINDVRVEQAEMARDAGIEGFCYWHYWFSREKQLLERPFKEVLISGKPDYPFCLGWANHSWTNKSWEAGEKKVKESVLMEMVYTQDEFVAHFYDVLPAFNDHRYITVDGKPLFVIFDPEALPDEFIPCWNELAEKNGLKGIHFVGIMSNLSGYKYNKNGEKEYYMVKSTDPAGPRYDYVLNKGFSAVNSRGVFRAELSVRGRWHKYYVEIFKRFLGIDVLNKFDYKEIIKYLFVDEDRREDVYPTLLPNWDRSARSGKKANIYVDSTPENFETHLKQALDIVQDKSPEHRILFLQSWNEWAEGNYVEPDLKYGHGFLDVIKKNIF